MAKMHAARALALVGTPFRPQGRDVTGLDCVGLAMRVFELPAETVPDDYRLRGRHLHRATGLLGRFFRRVSETLGQPGDLLLLAPRADQLHFAVLTMSGFVHAHAGLRRVVETPGDPGWPTTAVFRRRSRKGTI